MDQVGNHISGLSSNMSEISDHVNSRGFNYTSIPNSLTKWQKMQLSEMNSESGVECLLKTWNNKSYKDILQGGSFCDGIWDNVYCWPPTPTGTVLTRKCSDILERMYPDYAWRFKGKVTRICLSNASWAQDNEPIYDECVTSLKSYLKEIEEDAILAPVVHHMLFFGSLLSLLCLLGSLAIFYHYRCLRCDRVTVQTHLMLSLVLRFILMFFIAEPFVFGHRSSYRDVDILCETVLVLFLYTTFTSITWMFIQGLYLNVTLMTAVAGVNTQKHLRWYYIIGWVGPAAFVCVYVIAMSLKKQQRCWEGYSKMSEMWILLGPIMLELVVNGLFLCNILRILLRKVRNSNSRPDSSQIKATAKATAILFPVLGINNLMLLYNPGGEYNKYFVTLNTFFGSTQGIFVAIVYCFVNKEVLAAIQRSIQRANARRIEDNRIHTNDQPQVIRMTNLQASPSNGEPCNSQNLEKLL